MSLFKLELLVSFDSCHKRARLLLKSQVVFVVVPFSISFKPGQHCHLADKLINAKKCFKKFSACSMLCIP